MLPDMTQQLMIHKPTLSQENDDCLTAVGAALSNKSWVFDELHTATAMFASPATREWLDDRPPTSV